MVNRQTDQQLLREYAEDRSEAAFSELVHRHVDLVYSAALRMVCDTHLAEDVTQSVFVALAKSAPRLTDRPVLSGWLHQTAQNLAANVVRSEVRRRNREQEAVTMNELLAGPAETSWDDIAPQLDAALGELNDADRDALLLRYFEKKSAAEMAGVLGVSDEAAQKRVSRAVERLREVFSKRKVAVGASGLAALISANAVQSAPAGLAAAISAGVLSIGTAVTTSTAVAITKTIVMTALKKSLIALTVAVLAGAGIYEARQAAQLRSHSMLLEQQQASLAEQIQQLKQERDDESNQMTRLLAAKTPGQLASNQLEVLKLRGQLAQLQARVGSTDDTRESSAKSLLAREDQLKQLARQYPARTIPEFELLSDNQWLNAAMGAKFDTDKDIQQDLADLRHMAENNFVSQAQSALTKYLKANNGQFPTDLSQLQSYFATPMDEAILQRWEVAPASVAPSVGVGDPIITEKAPVDELDSRWVVGPNGYGSGAYQSPDTTSEIATMKSVMQAYAAANSGQQPTDLSQLLPYITTPEQQAAYQKLTQKFSTNTASQ